MLARLCVALAFTAVFSLAACGEEDGTTGSGEPGEDGTSSSTEPAQEPAEAQEEATGAAKFSGQDRRNYEDAKVVCGSFPPRKVASDLGIDVDVHTSEGLVRIAETYAADYRPNFRQAVFEGCLDGLPDP